MGDQSELVTTLTRGLRHRLSVPDAIHPNTKVELKDLGNILATYNLTRKVDPVVNGQNDTRNIHSGNPAVTGLFSFGVVTIILGIFRLFLPWKPQVVLLPSALLFGGITQFIAGFFDLFVGGTFSAVILISYGAFWTGNGMMMVPSMSMVYDEYVNLEDRHQAQAIYCFIWSFYTLMLTGVSLGIKSGTLILSWCLFFVFLTLLLEAIWYLTDIEAVIRASGVCAMLAALGSFYSGVTAIFEEQGKSFPVGHYYWCKDKNIKTQSLNMDSQLGISITGKPFMFDSVKWSEDGEICTCLENRIYIHTPILVGISSEQGQCRQANTLIQLLSEQDDFGESNVLEKPVHSSYTISESYRCATWSPTGLSPYFSCLLTVVTTKHRVLFFHEDPNNKSKWILHLDLTSSIKDIAIGNDDFETATQINRFHTLYAEWSQSIIIDPLSSKPAILATSNKNGEILLWSYSKEHGIQFQMAYKPHSSYVNLLQWSSWRQQSDNTYSSYIVSSSSDGNITISLIKIETNKSGYVSSTDTKILSTWFENNYTTSAIIKLYDDKENNRIKILVGKQTELFFGIFQINKDQKIQLIGDWMNYEIPRSDTGVTGAYWGNNGKTVYIYTYEGEELALSVEPNQLNLDNSLSVNFTLNLQDKFKQQWMEIISNEENEDEYIDTVPHVWSADTTPNNLYSIVLYTIASTADLHSFSDSKDSTYLTFVYHPSPSNEKRLPQLCDQLRSFVEKPYFFFVHPAYFLLIEQLEYLLDEEDSQFITTWLEVLDQLIEKDDDSKMDFSNDIRKSLYCRPNIIASQISVYVNQESKLYKLESKTKDSINLLKTKGQNRIVSNYVETFLNYINQQDDTFWNGMKDEDITQIILWCDRTLYELKAPKSLYEITKIIYLKLQTTFEKPNLFDSFDTEIQLIDAALNEKQVMEVELKSRQKCPACSDVIPFRIGPNNVVCANGHIWDRCSITMQIISTPFYRKCLKCNAKSILPKATDQLVSDKLVSLIPKCLDCGSTFIDVKL
ncbi:unnamed protein product [Cunninghamella blakesleeana]